MYNIIAMYTGCKHIAPPPPLALRQWCDNEIDTLYTYKAQYTEDFRDVLCTKSELHACMQSFSSWKTLAYMICMQLWLCGLYCFLFRAWTGIIIILVKVLPYYCNYDKAAWGPQVMALLRKSMSAIQWNTTPMLRDKCALKSKPQTYCSSSTPLGIEAVM